MNRSLNHAKLGYTGSVGMYLWTIGHERLGERCWTVRNAFPPAIADEYDTWCLAAYGQTLRNRHPDRSEGSGNVTELGVFTSWTS
jgi:hypothetical protein